MFTSFQFAGLLPLACLAIIGCAVLALELVYRWKSRSQYIGVDGSIRTLPTLKTDKVFTPCISTPTKCMRECLSASPVPSKKEQRIQAAGNRLNRHANHTRIVNGQATVFRVSCDVIAWTEGKVRSTHIWGGTAVSASEAIDLAPTADGGFEIKGDRS